ncbi:MAG TPA: TonB-dependent receptor [Thermoanaerobaculia bacterium]|nr:TonB-dependent receptor [Thermoanaerobaculia bacterium]
MKVSWRGVFLVLLALSPISLFAQATTGTILGTVTSGGNPLPGVTVTVSSPSLQGTRTAVSGEAGGYHFASLPPGQYTLTFDLEGMQKTDKRVTVNVAQTTTANVDMRVGPMSEAVTVTASAPPTAETTQMATNFDVEMINELPMGRTIDDIVLLAPSVTDGGPNDQITISGSHSYENLYLVNGVVVNENLRGFANPLYIEDAVQETTVLTGGVSAEFGRFTGGIVSTVTKSGGNEFSGSLRDSMTNPSWTKKSAFPSQVDPLDEVNDVYEGTFGGRILRDRLWFFTAGRYQKRDELRQTTQTNIPYDFAQEDNRIEAKLTANLSTNHNLVGSFISSDDERANTISSGSVVDLRSLTPYERTRDLLALSYSGVFTQNLLLEGRYSKMDDEFVNGAEARDLIEGTLLMDSSTRRRMWSPTFCGTPCPPKQRDNESWMLKSSYFLGTRGIGNHSLVGGVEEFHQLREENNFQSGSDFRIHGTFIQVGTDMFFGVNPDTSEIEWDPVPALSKRSDFAVRSFFVNDKWNLNEHWNFNLGLRYDNAFGKDQAGNKTVDDDAFSPRLAAAYDVSGNGRHRFGATYGRYVAKVDQGPADNTATAGRYASYYWDYKGPAINPPGTPASQLVPVPEVIRRVFAWFESVGGTRNTQYLNSVRIPGVTTRFDRSLNAPWMDEWTVGYSMGFGSRGFVRADFITRDWGDFYVIRRTLETGKARDPNGNLFDQGVIENGDDGLSREYRAIQLQGTYHPIGALTIGGNYTWSKLRGNVEGETPGFATSITDYQNRPEYTGFEEYNREGYLGPDMRHRANVWLQYDLESPVGRFNLSLLERYHSALSYSAAAAIDVRRGGTTGPADGVVNPGYTTVPSSVNYFFSERGALRVDDITSTDLGVNWYLPSIRGLRLFVEVDLLNVFNEQGVEDPDFVDKTVLTRRQATCLQTGTTTRCAAFNPFTEKPQEGVHWQKAATFGKTTSPSAYQLPRTYRFSLGMKF